MLQKSISFRDMSLIRLAGLPATTTDADTFCPCFTMAPSATTDDRPISDLMLRMAPIPIPTESAMSLRMDDRPMAQYDAITDRAAFSGGRVDDDAFLDRRLVPYLDGSVVATQDDAVPT